MRFTYQKFDSAREQLSNEKREMLMHLEQEKQEYFDREHAKFAQRMKSLTKMNDSLSRTLMEKHSTDEALHLCQNELQSTHHALQQCREEIESLKHQNCVLEEQNQRLQAELKQAQTAMIDLADQERSKIED